MRATTNRWAAVSYTHLDVYKRQVYKYTFKGNMVAVVSTGTAVLGLGDTGPEAGLPVMEGKAVLFKEFGGVDAFPICIDAHDAVSYTHLGERPVSVPHHRRCS